LGPSQREKEKERERERDRERERGRREEEREEGREGSEGWAVAMPAGRRRDNGEPRTTSRTHVASGTATDELKAPRRA
jgi:hypothetical protein